MTAPVSIDDPAFEAVYAERIEHDREAAIGALEALAAAHPRSVPVRALLTGAYHRCLDSAACAASARVLLALDPGHSDGLHRLAFSLMALGDDAGALAAYRRAYEVTRSGMAGSMAARLLHRLGRLEAAARACEGLIAATAPGDFEALHAQAAAMRIARDQGRPLAADRHAQAVLNALRLNPALVGAALADRDQTAAFPEWLGLVDKTRLAAVLRRGLAADPAGRVPVSFELPEARAALLAHVAGEGRGARWIVKPARGSGGQGIYVTDDPAAAADRHDVVVQRYIGDPRRVDGHKGHLRIYVLVTGAAPLRAWLYGEGVVRLAPEPYDPSPARLGEAAVHVTNTALHKGHPGLVVSADPRAEGVGHVRGLRAVLAADGLDAEAVMGRIGDQAAWFLRTLAREGLFARQAAAGPARAFGPKLIGFDMLLDQAGQPWLLEMQTSPAARGSPLVERINGEMFATMARMSVGVFCDDGLGAGELEALRTDPAALIAAEQALEHRERGLFRPLIV